MYKILVASIIVFMLALNCNQLNDPDSIEIDSASLQLLVVKAMNGDVTSNNQLSGLINLSLPVNNKYNKISIDSININNDLFYYQVLIEFPNPVYNCLAVYDQNAQAKIIDRSLNGYLDFSILRINEKSFIKLTETFLSKDIFELNRLSLYSVDSVNVDLVFRTYTRLKTPDNEFTQKIIELNEERIKTEINSLDTSSMANKGDVFLFDDDFRKYLSSSDIFSGFVRNEVKLLSYPYTNQLFSDFESALSSTNADDTSLINIDADVKSFRLTLSPGWIEDSTWSITKNVRTSLFGSTFRNSSAGAIINVAPLAARDSSEMYSTLPLTNSQSGNYAVRYSDKKDNGTTYLQYFEYIYCEKKFLIIFEANKQTYERNKIMYEKIINSFKIDC